MEQNAARCGRAERWQAASDTRYRFYDIRHFRASWWIYQKLNIKSLTTRFGHSSIQMTFDIYVTDAEKDHVVATALEDVLYSEATRMQH